MSRFKGNNKINIIFFLLMITVLLLITSRGIAANLNQRNIALTKEVSELVSTNQWIKYQISDKISLEKIEVHAKSKLMMIDVTNKDIRYLSVDLNYVNEIKQGETNKAWFIKLQENVGDIFDGQ
ncbi:MAG: hypothetical protein FD141_1235 [Fusobacteria bacterium]|nr:MAG: hypothetical protein FD141_1235 [Fusobacteriota bacterium]KAF0229948.1 MAG: hypothetical protein FD182_338 [Fusobacteriota bacterium]